jgi:hypothetical protein
MTIRLHMKLGLVAESQRPPDSPDTVLVVEPSIGSTIRTKGSLYLVVTGDGGGELRPATNMVAERLRHEYYYDESAGITVCLKKAIRAANRELRVTERLTARHGEGGPIGIALAVVRGCELYVATVGPAEAYLVRDARLLTLPEPTLESGLPNEDVGDAEVWHGDLVAGDSLILISPNATRRIGLSPIQDAVIQLHPQVAIDQIHRQLTGGGIGIAGGDGMIALEASEVPVTQKTQPLKPVWPSDSLAGVPDRSPIPMADTVIEGVSTVQHTAKQVQRTADGMLRHSVYGLFDRMPRRPVQRVRVTPIAVQRERQRRLASAVVGMLLVLTVVGASLWYLAGTRTSTQVDHQGKAQAAYAQVETDLEAVWGNGRNLLISDPNSALKFLEDAYTNIKIAHQYGYSVEQLAPLSGQVNDGLNQYYHVKVISPQVVLTFGSDQLTGLVLGSDGGAYVIDSTNDSVYRIDLATRAKKQIALKGQIPPGDGSIVATPRLLATGGTDVLILDSANQIWRWRPSAGATPGNGILAKLMVEDSGTWGAGVRAFGTFVTDPNVNYYSLYVVVPSAGQVLKYPQANDGTGYYAKARQPYVQDAGPNFNVSLVDDMYIDGSLYLLNNGVVERYYSGQSTVKNWTADAPGDTVIRPDVPFYTRIAADNPISDQGNLYGYDGRGRRVVSFTKVNGKYMQEFVLPEGSPYFSALKGMFIRTGLNYPTTLYWIESGNLLSAPLESTSASPSPGSGISTLAPTKAPAKTPTKAPTKAPAKTPTKAPTKAPY